MTKTTRHRRLRDLIGAGAVQLPGAFNALAARAIEKAGFDAIYVSGAGMLVTDTTVRRFGDVSN